MATYVAFLRGINVGGHRITNDELRDLVAALGLRDPTPYQASGNVVFTDDATTPATLEADIAAHLERELGYAVATFVRPVERVAELAGMRPFGDPPAGARLHVAFLRRPVSDDELAALRGLATDTDRVATDGRELLWQVAGGFADSPLASPAFERALGQPATLRTQTTLVRLAKRFGG